jgi:hypothetical protein
MGSHEGNSNSTLMLVLFAGSLAAIVVHDERR